MKVWKDLLAQGKPFAVAHRGYSGRYPENTLEAFQGAIEAGAKAVELDTRLTGDRAPVVIHDETVDRTTNGTGRVAAHPLDSIAQLDAGSWFGPAFGATTIPHLEIALAVLADRVLMNVELKPDAYIGPPRPDDLPMQVAHLIHKLRLEEQVVVSCFDGDILARVLEARPGLHASLLVEEIGDVAEVLRRAESVDALFVSPDADLLEASEVEALHAGGQRVVPYVANDAPTMRRLLEAGVDGFFTDEIDIARSVLEEA